MNKDIKQEEIKREKVKSAFRFHLYLFIVVNALLFVINYMFSYGLWWFLFPLFGWFIGIVLHICAVWPRSIIPAKRVVLIHFASYASVNLLLAMTDYLTSGAITWVLFPLIFWGTGLIVHAIVYQEFLSKPKTDKNESKIKRPSLDKLKSMSKRARLLASSALSSQNKIQDKSESSIPQEVGEKPKKIAPKLGIKKEKLDLTEEDKREIEKTESEMDLEEKDAICVVHKGTIVGTVYICPTCKSYYCLKCANALIEKGEKCWTCEREITP